MRRGVSGDCAVLAAIAIAAVGVGAFDQRPPGTRPVTGTDEAGLWAEMDKVERLARTNGDINTASGINEYVKQVACRVATEYCAEIRVYVMDRPVMNASMAPNGYSEVWSGLLLRANNEAELAFVLAHEVSHFAENHTVDAMRAQRNRSNVALALQVGVAVVGAYGAANATTYESYSSIMDNARTLIDVIYLSSISAFFAYSRQQESEADLNGLARLKESGYDPSAAVAMWKAQIAESKASDFERVRRGATPVNAYRTHPLDEDRVKALSAKVVAGSGGELGQEQYRAAIRPHISSWLRQDLRRRDFGQTLHLINRLAENGSDLGVLNFFRGEAYRLRQKDAADLSNAIAAYEAAVGSEDAPAAAWRELGEMHRKRGNVAQARSAFETYLQKAPDAEDAWLVRDSLKGLQNG